MFIQHIKMILVSCNVQLWTTANFFKHEFQAEVPYNISLDKTSLLFLKKNVFCTLSTELWRVLIPCFSVQHTEFILEQSVESSTYSRDDFIYFLSPPSSFSPIIHAGRGVFNGRIAAARATSFNYSEWCSTEACKLQQQHSIPFHSSSLEI